MITERFGTVIIFQHIRNGVALGFKVIYTFPTSQRGMDKEWALLLAKASVIGEV